MCLRENWKLLIAIFLLANLAYCAFDDAKSSLSSHLKELKSYYQLDPFRDGPYISIKEDELIRYEIIPLKKANQIKKGNFIKSQLSDHQFSCTTEQKPSLSFNFSINFQNNSKFDSTFNFVRLKVLKGTSGDFHQLVGNLLEASLINEDLSWIAKNLELVILGDIVGEGLDNLPCLWYLYKLEKEASNLNSKVSLVISESEDQFLSGIYHEENTKYKNH